MKHLACSVILILSILLSGCNNKKPVQEAVTRSPKPEVSTYAEMPSPSAKSTILYETITKTAKDDSFIYYNEAYGYELTFPNDWLGFFYITESEGGSACVMYYGYELVDNNTTRVHFPLFYICTRLDECYSDSAMDIGKSGDTELSAVFPEESSANFQEKDSSRYAELKDSAYIVTATFRGDISENGRTESGLTNQSCTITSERHGYTIRFPESWAGWFYTVEQDDGVILIVFFGKSELGSIYYKSQGGGLPLYYLATQENIEDRFDKTNVIGQTSKTIVYAASGTGSDINILSNYPLYDEKFVIETEEEKGLMAADLDKAYQMISDLNAGNLEFINNG